jgi:hypothetical protein
MPAEAEAGDKPAAAAAAVTSAGMHELVAALMRGTAEDQGAASSAIISTLPLTPQAAGQALSEAQHEEQRQQQQDALIQQLLLQTQPGQHDALCFQLQAGSSSYLKAAWGSGGGDDEASATPAAAANAAAANSGGAEQLLAALRGTAANERVTACSSVQDESLGKSEQHAEADTTKSSAVQLALLLQGQQQQQAASACRDVETAGANYQRAPDAAVLGNNTVDNMAAAAHQQQQQLPGAAAALEMSQSPLRARQLQYGEASPGAAGDSSQPEFTLSQLVHALQDTGDNQAGRNAVVELAPGAAALGAHPGTTAAAAAAAEAKEDIFWSIHSAGKVAEAVVDGADVAGISDMYRIPTSTPPEEQQLQAAAKAPIQQQQSAAAQPAQATAEPKQQQQQRQPAAVAAAVAGLQPCSLSSMAVAFDPRIPPELEQELAAAVVAAGGSVVPGQPHLGCGANTVVAEPQHAAQWLQLLMHIVSPAWLLKACRQQQKQQGCRQQQLMCLSPDVARALGQGGRQNDGAAAAITGVENSMCAASSLNRCSNATSPADSVAVTAAAPSILSSSTVGATAQAAGNSDSSSCCRVRGTVLLVPEAALSVEGMGLWWTSAAAAGAGEFGQQQQPQLMPPGLLEGVVWSVDQDPRCVCRLELVTSLAVHAADHVSADVHYRFCG